MSDSGERFDSLTGLSSDGSGEASALVVAIDEAVDAQRRLEQQLRKEFGTNNTDFRALLLVFRMRRAGKVPRVGDLSRAFGLTSGAASQATKRLTDASLLQQDRDPDDARAGSLSLTDDAHHRLAEATRDIRTQIDAILDGVDSSEETRIIGLLQQVRDVFVANHAERAQGS